MASALAEIRGLDAFYDEAANRPVRRRTVDVVDYQPSRQFPEFFLALEGTLTVLAARKGSPLMADIRAALRSGSGDTRAVATRLYTQFRNRKGLTFDRALKKAVSADVFADVLHGDRVLAEGVFVPRDLEVAVIPLPYNGGPLADDGIVVVEHPADEGTDPLDILVLRRAPVLTKAERAAIDKVPKAQRTMNVGHSPGPRACSVLLLTAAVVVEAAIVAVTYTITGKVHLGHMAHIRPSDLKKMGPSKSARELVKMRRSLMKKRPKKSKKAHG
jgi:hypothetical protein